MNVPKDYVRASLGVATAQICQGLGWHSVHRSSHDILTDVLERYINQLSKTAVNISQTCCRTMPNLDDVALTFEHLGIHVHELKDYIQQVEASPNTIIISNVPVKKSINLLDFSGEDNLPAFVDIKVNEESEVQEKEEVIEEKIEENGSKEERPKTLSFHHKNSIESPPYSPLEPKSLNLGALSNLDLTRPDLKVVTPKGFTPITSVTSSSLVSTITTTVNFTSPVSISTTTTTTTSSIITTTPSATNQSKLYPIVKVEPCPQKAFKKEKKDPSEKKKSTPDRKEPRKESLFSPSPSSRPSTPSNRPSTPSNRPSTPNTCVVNTPTTTTTTNTVGSSGKSKKSKSQKNSSHEKREKDTPNSSGGGGKKSSKNVSNNSPSPFRLHDSLDSPFSPFGPPRKKLAMYQSDKKKPPKEKTSKESKSEKPSPSFSKDTSKDSKNDKSSKLKSPPVSNNNNPSSSSAVQSPAESMRIPPSVKRELSPPNLSSPIIKRENSANRTVIFPAFSNNSSPSHASHSSLRVAKETINKETDDTTKEIKQEKPDFVDVKKETKTTSGQIQIRISDIKKDVSYSQPLPIKEKSKKNDVESSEYEIDVTSFSQDESYSDTFKPNMFFPTAFGEEKKKKKKKNKDKNKEDKAKKGDVTKDKKEKKRKRDDSGGMSSAIPRLTLKMGTETISDAPSKFPSAAPRGPCSPLNKFSTAISASASLLPPSSSSHPSSSSKKKKNKHKQKEKEKDKKKEKEKGRKREMEEDDDYQGVFYAESLPNTSAALGGKVYYCPACSLPDDGSPMIGCDDCDDWYHWPCVGIEEEPDEEEKWFCPNCPKKAAPAKKKKKKKKRNDLDI